MPAIAQNLLRNQDVARECFESKLADRRQELKACVNGKLGADVPVPDITDIKAHKGIKCVQ